MGKEILNIHCPQCGAPANFDIVHQVYECGYCGGTVKVEAALEEKKDYRDAQQKKMKKSAEAFALESASCSGCGATIVFEENEALSKCAFCGRSLVRKEYLYDAGLPESVIPFRLTKAEAQQRLEEWCDRNSRKKEAKHLRPLIPELKGFYLPYEMVRGPVHCRVSCKRTAEVYGFEGFVNDEFVNGSKQLDNLLLDAMEPFDLDGLEAFDFAYVAGQHVKITDISEAEAERRMTEEVSENYRPQLEKMWGTKAIKINTEAKSAVRLPVLLPVYYISGGDIHAAVNGQTGKVSVRAEKKTYYVTLPWWLKAMVTLLLAVGATFSAMALSGMDLWESLGIAGMLGIFYLIVYLCMLGDFANNSGEIGSYRKIFTSGERTFRRDGGKLVLREEILERKVARPVFLRKLDGKVQPVVYLFRSPKRMMGIALLSFAVIFLPAIVALFLNGFDFARLSLGGSAVWFCITVPVVPIYFVVFGMARLYDAPWIYTLTEDGGKKRYRKKIEITWKKVVDGLAVVLVLLIKPPLCLAVWFGIASFCTMCYLTAFGF